MPNTDIHFTITLSEYMLKKKPIEYLVEYMQQQLAYAMKSDLPKYGGVFLNLNESLKHHGVHAPGMYQATMQHQMVSAWKVMEYEVSHVSQEVLNAIHQDPEMKAIKHGPMPLSKKALKESMSVPPPAKKKGPGPAAAYDASLPIEYMPPAPAYYGSFDIESMSGTYIEPKMSQSKVYNDLAFYYGDSYKKPSPPPPPPPSIRIEGPLGKIELTQVEVKLLEGLIDDDPNGDLQPSPLDTALRRILGVLKKQPESQHTLGKTADLYEMLKMPTWAKG